MKQTCPYLSIFYRGKSGRNTHLNTPVFTHHVQVQHLTLRSALGDF